MPCSLCGSDKSPWQHYQFGEYRLRCCPQCGHAVTEPLADRATLDALYTAAYFAEHYEEIAPDDARFNKRIAQEDHRVRFLRRFKKGGRLLDVGCGRGYFLQACRKRFQGTAFDVSTSNRDYIAGTLKLEFVGDRELLRGRQFEAITFWHSLEHFADPGEQLAFFSSLLAPGGVLIIDVPNHHSIDAYMEGSRWPGWDVPFHCHHFTRDSLELLVGQQGLAIIGHKLYACGYVRERLAALPLLRPLARPLAKLLPGASVVLACRRAHGGS